MLPKALPNTHFKDMTYLLKKSSNCCLLSSSKECRTRFLSVSKVQPAMWVFTPRCLPTLGAFWLCAVCPIPEEDSASERRNMCWTNHPPTLPSLALRNICIFQFHFLKASSAVACFSLFCFPMMEIDACTLEQFVFN